MPAKTAGFPTTRSLRQAAASEIPPRKAILQARNLSKAHCKTAILGGVSCAYHEGSVTTVIGENGAGKTTLALLLAGFARPTGDEILLYGKRRGASRRRKHIYFCGNDTGTQFFTPSVSDELLLNTERSAENLETARALLKRMGLYAYKDAHPASLSGGQKQRLAIACALFSGRDVLILDAPTSGLDGANMELVAEELRRAAQAGKTMIVITHDCEPIKSCCDSLVEIRRASERA